MNNASNWWAEDYGFFGSFYIEGDNSQEGFLANQKQNLVQRTTTETNGIIGLLKLSAGAQVMDIPCGYGRHSIALAGKGFQVTGVDINSYHLNKARAEAKLKSVNVNFIKDNMLTLKSANQFDAVINMFYSFGFFDSDQENEQVAKNFYDVLKPEGKFLMHTDVNVPRIISGKYKTDEVRQLANGNTLRIVEEYNPYTKRINGMWLIADGLGMVKRKNYSVRVYTKDEFIGLCKKVGFSNCEAYSDWQGRPYSEDSEEMIIVATK